MSEKSARKPPADLPHIPGYEIRELLGKGGQGAVYRARQKSLHRVVAIKVLDPKHADSKSLKRRFLGEARLQSKLHHPNILQGIDVREHEGLWYFVMEFVSGTDAQVLLSQRGPLPEREVLEIARQVADALVYAHEHGIVHGDIKPENIVLAADGSVKMIDFGIARLAREENRKSGAEGTKEFMAPEVKSGKTKGDVRSDMFSLGVTLYELLTASLPPLAKGTAQEGPDPKDREPAIGIATAALVKKLLAADPGHRPDTPRALLKAVDRALAHAPLKKVVDATSVAKRSGRRKGVLAPLAVAALLLGGAWALLVALQREDDPAPDTTTDRGAETDPRTDTAPEDPKPKPPDPGPERGSDPPDVKPPPPKPGPTTDEDPPAPKPPKLTFLPDSVQVLEGEAFSVRVTAVNLPVALKPLIRVLDAEGRDISATVDMPTVKRDPTDHRTVSLEWTAPYWPLHDSHRVAILVSQPPLQEKLWVGIDDRNRPPQPRTDAIGPVLLKEGGDPVTVALDAADPDKDEASFELVKATDGIEAAVAGDQLILRAKDRPGTQGGTEFAVVLRAEDDGGASSELSVPILIQDVDHPIRIDWELGESPFEIIPADSEGDAVVLRGPARPGLNAHLKVSDPDVPQETFSIALRDGQRLSGLSLKPAEDGRSRITWRGSTSDPWGPRSLTLVASTPNGTAHELPLRLQVVRRIHPGTTTSTEPLDRALHWLRRHQLDDGSFPVVGRDFARFSEDAADWGVGREEHRSGLVALAVIAALRAGDASPWVVRAARHLVDKQDPEGKVAGAGRGWIYSHAIASEALVLAFHILGNEEFRMPAKKAIWFLDGARNPGPTGAWRYGIKPGESDTSVTIWAVRALLAARMAGIHVEEDALRGGMAFIEAMMAKDGRIGYQEPGGPPVRASSQVGRFLPKLSESLTAAGLSVLLYSPMIKSTDPRLQKGRRIVLGCPPAWSFRSRPGAVLIEKLTYDEKRRLDRYSTLDFYYWQHATALFRTWRLVRNKTIYRATDWRSLVSLAGSHQRKSGDAKGSWDPDDAWGADGGRTYATAMLALAIANLQFTNPLVGE